MELSDKNPIVPATMIRWQDIANTLGERDIFYQNRGMSTLSPSTTDQFLPTQHLRVRFGPLMRWFFIAFFLLAQLYLATRLWAGWRPRALARVLVMQLFFTPRLVFAGFAFSAISTIFAERFVRWIARPTSRMWLSPTKGLPEETELPLFIRVGEQLEIPFRARRKGEHGWEPGWLILTDQRLFWLSGVWRTTQWELDRQNPLEPILDRLEFQTPPRWLGGYVVGMPPRICFQMRPTAYSENDHAETVALAEPQTLLEHLDPELAALIRDEAAAATAKPAKPVKTRQPVQVRPIQYRNPITDPLSARGVQLPARRVKKAKPPVIRPEVPKSHLSGHPLPDPGQIQLPPRRKQA